MKYFNKKSKHAADGKFCIKCHSLSLKNSDSDTLKAEITVFFALITAIIMALFLSVLESARTSAARLHMTIAANSAIDSLFSQYHKKLWQDYRILGLEQYDYQQLTDEMSNFIEPYFNVKNWYPQKLTDIEITELKAITDENGEIFETEILDYMKYGIMAEIWDLIDIDIFDKGRYEGASADSVSDIYSSNAKFAAKIEKKLEELAECISREEADISSAQAALNSCDGAEFISKANQAISELKKMPGIIKDYEKLADKLGKELGKSRARFDGELANGSLSKESWEIINEDILQFESYVREDGERRQEISSISSLSDSNIEFLKGLIEEAREIMDYISNWEPEDEDDELDEYALWAPIRRAMSSYSHPHVGCSYGIQDKETEGRLESIKALLSGDVLKLVTPDGAKLSTESLMLEDSPSSLHAETDISRLGLLDRVYTVFYAGAELNYFGRGIYDAEQKKGTGGCELEYVIYGKNSDSENLRAAVSELIKIRTGLNLIYLYRDSEKKAEAKALAAAIAGVAGLTPMISVLTFFILSVWSLGQAVVDIRHLLNGKRVPFMHTPNSFSLSLSGLLSITDRAALDAADSSKNENDEENGLSYSDYLKILMFTGYGSTNAYRIMDVIQMSIKATQKDFRMDRLVYSLQTRVNVYAEHLFSQLGVVKAFRNVEKNYNMSVPTSFSY